MNNIPDIHLLCRLSICVILCRGSIKAPDQEDWRAGIREKKHFTGHFGAVCVTQKPFHISGIEARGKKYIVNPLHFLDKSQTT